MAKAEANGGEAKEAIEEEKKDADAPKDEPKVETPAEPKQEGEAAEGAEGAEPKADEVAAEGTELKAGEDAEKP